MTIHKAPTRFLLFLSILIVVFVSLAYRVEGAVIPCFFENPGPGGCPSTDDVLGQTLYNIAKYVVRLGIPVLTFLYILTGLMFVAAQGNEQKLTEAKRMFYWLVVGTAIIMGAGTIALIIYNLAKSFS